jgi:hypothetical protein
MTLQEWHVSFNGLAFDSQITEHILKNKEQLLNKMVILLQDSL